MIRVAHLFDTSGPGGAETVLVTLIRGMDSTRFTSVPFIRQNSWMHSQLLDTGCDFCFLEGPRAYDIGFLAGLVRLLKQQKVDLVHSHEFFMNIYGTMAARMAGIPSVATIHGQVAYAAAKFRRRLAYRFMALSGSPVIVSNQLAERFQKEVGVPRRRIRVIHNGIELHPFTERQNLDSLRNELDVPREAPVIGMVGSLYPLKGYPFFLRAMELVKKEFPSAKFMICGRGKLENELKTLAAQCGLNGAVQFLGFRSDVPRLLQLMDVFVLSSLAEGLSLSILEAMAAARPTVVTDVGGNREIVVEGETGFLIPPENPSAIAEKTLFLLRNKPLAIAMGKAGRRRVQTHFSRDIMLQNYQELYESLVRKQGV